MSMALGMFFLFIIMLTFSVTHMIKFQDDDASVEMAGELALIVVGALTLYLIMRVLTGLI
jgi:hypothetical protein